VLGQPKLTTGRFKEHIERAVRFRLRAIEHGSVVPVLELAPPPGSGEETLDLDDATLGESAVLLLLDAVDDGRSTHPVVLRGLLELADQLDIGGRYETIDFDARIGSGARHTCIDAGTRERLTIQVTAAERQAARPDAVGGTLVEADFERRTARLRTSTDVAVHVEFSPEFEDEIQAALRHPATMRGDVTYDPLTHVAKRVTVRNVERGAQMELIPDVDDFWSERSFADLANEQGAGEPVDPESLYDPDATEDERGAFMAAIADLGT
jgi:hypothetical protein